MQEDAHRIFVFCSEPIMQQMCIILFVCHNFSYLWLLGFYDVKSDWFTFLKLNLNSHLILFWISETQSNISNDFLFVFYGHLYFLSLIFFWTLWFNSKSRLYCHQWSDIVFLFTFEWFKCLLKTCCTFLWTLQLLMKTQNPICIFFNNVTVNNVACEIEHDCLFRFQAWRTTQTASGKCTCVLNE